MAGSDTLGIQPLPERYGTLFDTVILGETVSYHRAQNLRLTEATQQVAAPVHRASGTFGYYQMIFRTTRFGRLPSHSP